jgi:hypothetical protein
MAGIGDGAARCPNKAQAIAIFDGRDHRLTDELTASALTGCFVDPVYESLLDLYVYSHVPKLAQSMAHEDEA